MRTAREHPRFHPSFHLRAHLRPSGRAAAPGRVLDLSAGGMLVTGSDLRVGERTGFELDGPDFHYAGVAEVAHLTGGTTGLRFLSWQGEADRPVRSLLERQTDWMPPTGTTAANQPAIRRVAVLVGRRRSPREGV